MSLRGWLTCWVWTALGETGSHCSLTFVRQPTFPQITTLDLSVADQRHATGVFFIYFFFLLESRHSWKHSISLLFLTHWIFLWSAGGVQVTPSRTWAWGAVKGDCRVTENNLMTNVVRKVTIITILTFFFSRYKWEFSFHFCSYKDLYNALGSFGNSPISLQPHCSALFSVLFSIYSCYAVQFTSIKKKKKSEWPHFLHCPFSGTFVSVWWPGIN